MKVASPTATRAHQRRGISPLLSCTSYLYLDHVRRSRTSFLYKVQHSLTLTCTTYSCQVMDEMQSSAPEPGASREHARLSKAAVVGQALALADTLGLEALTIRRLAT